MNHKNLLLVYTLPGLVLFVYLFLWSLKLDLIIEKSSEPILIPKHRVCTFDEGQFISYPERVFQLVTPDCGIFWIKEDRYNDIQKSKLMNKLQKGDTISIGFELPQNAIFPYVLSLSKNNLILLDIPVRIHEITKYVKKENKKRLLPYLILLTWLILIYIILREDNWLKSGLREAKEISSTDKAFELPIRLDEFKFSNIHDKIHIDKYKNSGDFEKIVEIDKSTSQVKILWTYFKKSIKLGDIQELLLYIRTEDKGTKVIATIYIFTNDSHLSEILSIVENKNFWDKESISDLRKKCIKLTNYLSIITGKKAKIIETPINYGS